MLRRSPRVSNLMRMRTSVYSLSLSVYVCLFLSTDLSKLLATASRSASLTATIGNHVLWRHLWDMALDKGVKGTRSVQNLFRELCHSASCFMCTQCESHPSPETTCLEHTCSSHPNLVHNLLIDVLVSTLTGWKLDFLLPCPYRSISSNSDHGLSDTAPATYTISC